MIDPSKKYRTRAGHAVRALVITDPSGSVGGEYETSPGKWAWQNWTKDGHQFWDGAESAFDLIEAQS